MSNCAIVGINWGDEGKGRMVDYLTQQYDVVVRYQGGGNAGHTVINEKGKFALHLLPSGIFRSGVMNILGNGVALDCENLLKEIDTVRQGGVDITPENLLVSERASLLLPWHRELDALEEQRLKDKKYGSTKQGIAPFYSDKYQKKTVLAGELLYPDHLRAHLQDLLEWKNLILREVYGAKGYTMDEMMAWVEQYGQRVKPYVADTGRYLHRNDRDELGVIREVNFARDAKGTRTAYCKGYFSEELLNGRVLNTQVSLTGTPEAIGITDLAHPDYGDAVTIRPGETPVFWPCGVTPQAVVMHSKPEFCITHAPGYMFVTDVKNTLLKY